jgi:hypothetical protein
MTTLTKPVQLSLPLRIQRENKFNEDEHMRESLFRRKEGKRVLAFDSKLDHHVFLTVKEKLYKEWDKEKTSDEHDDNHGDCDGCQNQGCADKV